MKSKCDLIFDRISAQKELDKSMQAHIETCSECQQIAAAVALVQKYGSPARELQPTEEFINQCSSSANTSIAPFGKTTKIILASLIAAATIGAAFLSITIFSDQLTKDTDKKSISQTTVDHQEKPFSNSIEEKDSLIIIDNSKNRLIFDSPADEVE